MFIAPYTHRLPADCDMEYQCTELGGRVTIEGRHRRLRRQCPRSMDLDLTIRPYKDDDHDDVRRLFIRVNRVLAPPSMKEAFERYIERSIAEEIGRIRAYYGEHDGRFYVARRGDAIVGMFGLERIDETTMELRRMYVALETRRLGIGRKLLEFAETVSRSLQINQLILSTSELQEAALAMYKNAGYRLLKTERANTSNVKTVGAGLLRYYFAKPL